MWGSWLGLVSPSISSLPLGAPWLESLMLPTMLGSPPLSLLSVLFSLTLNTTITPSHLVPGYA